jgi:hypothetical protein
VRGARTVCSPVEDLRRGERFDVVMLGSILVHARDRERRALLDSCVVHARYSFPDATWAALAQAGLTVDACPARDGTWVCARLSCAGHGPVR